MHPQVRLSRVLLFDIILGLSIERFREKIRKSYQIKKFFGLFQAFYIWKKNITTRNSSRQSIKRSNKENMQKAK